MSIYRPVLPYVYRIDHPTTGEFYIGSRRRNVTLGITAEEDFGYIYQTSSKNLSHPFKEYNQTIIAEFFDGDDAYDFEQLLIYENWSSPLLLNKNCTHGKNRFRVGGPQSEEHIAKRSAAMMGKKQSEEHIAKIRATNKGKKLSAEHKAKISAANKGKTKGKKRGPQSKETKDKRSAAMMGKNKGKKQSEEHIAKRATANKGKKRGPRSADIKDKIRTAKKGKPSPKLVCRISDHKEMDMGNFTKWVKMSLSLPLLK